MAGYIMTIGATGEYEKFNTFDGSKAQLDMLKKNEAMTQCIKNGIYATMISEVSNAKIATRADYFGMRKGDNIYFFFNRCIYGIGEIIDIKDTCCFINSSDDILFDFGNNSTHPFFCLFKSSPFFFKDGVDMDDVLMSRPEAFRKLRFFQKRSFIQLDDVENSALRSYIIQKHEDCLVTYDIKKHYDSSNQLNVYNKIKTKFLSAPSKYSLNAVETFKEGTKIKKHPNRIKSEYYVEGLILDYVKRDNKLLGRWDFMARQYVASPCKPAEYADNMDLFGYRYVKGYEREGIISKYVIIEIKAQEIDEDAILQLMKYVDWVCKEFAHNDYSMIEAYLVGYTLKERVLEYAEELYTRNYIKSSKRNINRGIEVLTDKWKNIKYLSYVDILNDMISMQEHS